MKYSSKLSGGGLFRLPPEGGAVLAPEPRFRSEPEVEAAARDATSILTETRSLFHFEIRVF